MLLSTENTPDEDQFVTPTYDKYNNIHHQNLDTYQQRSDNNLIYSPHLIDAYTMRSLEEQKTKAIEYWTLRTKVLCIFQFV